MNKPGLLLHICCASCAAHVLNILSEKYDVTGYFYNPNIEPKKEFDKRLEAVKQLQDCVSFPLIIGSWENELWRGFAVPFSDEPEGGRRCSECFRIRLEETARTAIHGNLETIATTLTVGPMKPAGNINSIGVELAEKYDLTFLAADFKKKDGFKKSVELSRQYGLYRQNYCGCSFSAGDKKYIKH